MESMTDKNLSSWIKTLPLHNGTIFEELNTLTLKQLGIFFKFLFLNDVHHDCTILCEMAQYCGHSVSTVDTDGLVL